MNKPATTALATTALARQEARLAWGLLAPTFLSVLLVILIPLFAVFWISVKPIELADLRTAEPSVYERLSGKLIQTGDQAKIEYRLRNKSRKQNLYDIILIDDLPTGLQITQLPDQCVVSNQKLTCQFPEWAPGFRIKLRLSVTADATYIANPVSPKQSKAIITGTATSPLWNDQFTLNNYLSLFESDEFLETLIVTLAYAFFGTVGALLLGLKAALLLNKSFMGQGLFRGILLFPYIAPVIAVAFTWVTLLDPFSGSLNALLLQMGFIDTSVNFFGDRPQALIMVTVFEIWRYFPLSFLFILARLQSMNMDIYEAADMDGASPFQKLRYLLLPQLLGILSVLFLLRFIWTFNKFDDIFLLTGGNAGTRTLTVNVYEQAFAISNIGAGAAVAVVIFALLLLFSLFFFRFMNKEDGL